MYIDSSKDIFYLVMSISVALLTFFICWVIYYAIKAEREILQTVRHFRSKIDAFEAAIKSKKQKIEHSLNSLNFMGQAVKMITEYIIKKRFTKDKDDKK